MSLQSGCDRRSCLLEKIKREQNLPCVYCHSEGLFVSSEKVHMTLEHLPCMIVS